MFERKMRQSSIFFLFIVFFLFMKFPSANSWCTNNNLVDAICKNYSSNYRHYNDSTDDYIFCKASLQAVPGSRCASPLGLGFIAINLLRYNTSSTKWHIRGLLRNRSLDQSTRRNLEYCLYLYKENAKTLTDVAKEYMAGKLEDAGVHVSAVITSLTICENGFQSRGLPTRFPGNSPLTKRNSDASRLAAISRSIINMQKS